jgi:hypothetical protein
MPALPSGRHWSGETPGPHCHYVPASVTSAISFGSSPAAGPVEPPRHRPAQRNHVSFQRVAVIRAGSRRTESVAHDPKPDSRRRQLPHCEGNSFSIDYRISTAGAAYSALMLAVRKDFRSLEPFRANAQSAGCAQTKLILAIRLSGVYSGAQVRFWLLPEMFVFRRAAVRCRFSPPLR